MPRLGLLMIACLVAGAAMAQPAMRKTLEDMTPAEIEALSNDLIATCKRMGVHMGSRAFDDCVKAEAKRRGVID